MRGFCAIGVWHPKFEVNIGTLWRSAHIFGVSFIFTIGGRYRRQPCDTTDAAKHVPLFHWETLVEFFEKIPIGAEVVVVEQACGGAPLESFEHPERSVYLLGGEDCGVPGDIRKLCHRTVEITTPRDFCLNLAVAGSIVLYDRLLKQANRALKEGR